jgi:cyanophycin synthetase
MRRVEIRLLDGPNLYRLEPAVKIELAVGRRRTWFGDRLPEAHARVRLGAVVRPADAPEPIAAVAAWVGRLHRLAHADGWLAAEGRRGRVPVTIHRTSEPGHWVVAFPWREEDRAERIADAAIVLAERGVPVDVRPRGSRTLRRALESIDRASPGAPPAWIRDAERRIPVISLSGTNGKTTTTRMIGAILRAAGRRVGMTTSDGVVVDDRIIEEGDLTGPLGARGVLRRDDLDVAVLETARGGLVLRGMGYESNDAAVITNVSSDHLDLHGIHTLPEIAEVKSVIARVTRPDGAVVLNAHDELVAAIARDVRAPVWWFSMDPRHPRVRRIGRPGARVGVRAFVLREETIVELDAGGAWPIVPVAEIPATLGGVALHNVANALAAAAGGRAMGATREEVAAGLRAFRPTADQAPGRLNRYADGRRTVIVDFAHNEAGLAVALATARGLARRIGPDAPVVAIIGTAGDRPDDTLRAIGRVAAETADAVAIKESLHYLRGRTREGVIGELRTGLRQGGMDPASVPVHIDEVTAVRAELTDPARPMGGGAAGVLLVMTHEQRSGVAGLLAALGFTPLD